MGQRRKGAEESVCLPSYLQKDVASLREHEGDLLGISPPKKKKFRKHPPTHTPKHGSEIQSDTHTHTQRSSCQSRKQRQVELRGEG